MKKSIVVSGVLSVLAIVMIAIAMTLQVNKDYGKVTTTTVALKQINVKNMASSNRVLDTSKAVVEEEKVEEVSMEVAEQAVEPEPPAPPRIEVYANLTIEELSAKLDRNLGNGYLAGKGTLIANSALQLGVDPYVAVAIILHETGCKYSCSNLVRSCNNVGGQKGSPGCGGGSYKSYPTLDDGIVGFMNNLYKNYYSKGLNTVATIAPRYAESSAWPAKINAYVAEIQAN